MAITITQNVVGTQTTTATGSYSLTATSFTPASGDLMVAFVTIFDAVTGVATCTGGDVSWNLLAEEDGTALNRDGFVFGATATAATAVVVQVDYSATATGGYAFGRALVLQGHAGFGSITTTFVDAATTLVVGTLNHTANSAVLTGHHSNQPETNLPTTFTGAGSLTSPAAGGTVSMNVSYNLDIGASGTASIQWGTNPGTSMTRRRVTMIEVLPAATVTFNYGLLEGIVQRGVSRGVGRGVA